tara:strand:+ start:169 stop:303 length:135 start_codon:yes stop_codon:yes gene_type:complete
MALSYSDLSFLDGTLPSASISWSSELEYGGLPLAIVVEKLAYSA